MAHLLTREQAWWAEVMLHRLPDDCPEAWQRRRVEARMPGPRGFPLDYTPEQADALARFLDRVAESGRPAAVPRPDRLRAAIWITARELGLGRARLARRFGCTPAFAEAALRSGPAIVARTLGPTSPGGDSPDRPGTPAPGAAPRPR